MNFDNTISIYTVITPEMDFERATAALLEDVKRAQVDYPDWPRLLFVDIVGHTGARYGFDDDFFEFQQEFFFATIAHFVTAFELPLTGPLMNPERQRNDVPDSFVINGGGENP